MASNKLRLNIVAIFSLLLLLSTTPPRGCAACGTKAASSPAENPAPSQAQAPAPANSSCSTDTLKLGVCVGLLGLVNLPLGTPPSSSCCALLQGLVDLEAAVCLCTAIKANVVGINLDVPVTLSLLVSACNKTVPSGFTCA